jgi:hypothetical protein
MKIAEFLSLTKFMLPRSRRISLFGGSTTALATAGLVLFAAVASASVVGTVTISSGSANAVASGTSVSFTGNPPGTLCDATAVGSAFITGGCAGGQVSTYGPGVLGTPNGPLESTVNGVPPVNSAVFIAPISLGTSFPLIPFMQFLNAAGNGVGITVEADTGSFGTGTQTKCAGLALFATCSIYTGAIFILENLGSNGTQVTLPFSGFAWDGSATTRPAGASTFGGSFSQTLTFVTGITGTGPGGFVTPADVQNFFGCPTGSTGTTIGQCTTLNNTIQSADTGTFTAVITAVPEPETTAMTLIGAALLALGFWRRRSQA